MKRILDKVFRPNSIAVVGASDRRASVGYNIFNNLIQSEYPGHVFPVNLRHYKVQRQKAYRNLQRIRAPIDLVIMATPWDAIPDVLSDCAEIKVEVVMIISVPIKINDSNRELSISNIKKIAFQHGIRILGSRSLGVANPPLGLNATIVDHPFLPGNLAFITESGAIGKSIIYWAHKHHFGFKYFVSTGSMDDLNIHELIDYFGTDPGVKCILIYLETLKNPKQFISAARAFSRDKPILVLKGGNIQNKSASSFPLTTILNSEKLLYEIAFRRAGIIRVDSIAQLFYTGKALAMQPVPQNNRLAIVTNARGPAILATDYLINHGGNLVQLPNKISHQINTLLPAQWYQKAQTDAIGKEISSNYQQAITSFIDHQKIDGILIMYTPQAIQESQFVVKAMVQASSQSSKTIIACCQGGSELEVAVNYLEQNQIPNYEFPEIAVEVFLRMSHYAREIDVLYETPDSIMEDFNPEVPRVNKIIHDHLVGGKKTLFFDELQEMLGIYQLPICDFMTINHKSEIIGDKIKFEFPWVIKLNQVLLDDQVQSDCQISDIKSIDEAIRAFHLIKKKCQNKGKNEKPNTLIIQPQPQNAQEFVLSAFRDKKLGPFLTFGMGGILSGVYSDWSMEIPPLNAKLAQQLIGRIKAIALLKNSQLMDNVDLTDLQTMLIRFSYIISNHPQINSIQTKLVLVPKGFFIVDSIMELNDHIDRNCILITPYPAEWTRSITLKNRGKFLIRPIKPEDEPLEANMVEYLSQETIYFRFFGYPPEISHQFLSRFTHIDYDREMAFVAIKNEKISPQMTAVVRLIAEPLENQAEYAIIVADPWQKQGLGSILTDLIIEYGRFKGYNRIFCSVLKNNQEMIRLLQKKEFQTRDEDSITLYAWIDL